VITIEPERPGDRQAVDTLARLSLGNRVTDSPAARMRRGTRAIEGLSLVVLENDDVVGTLRFWPVVIGRRAKALQLGPLAIHPDHRGRGFSRLLVRQGLERAEAQGHRIVVLIGDPAIYGRYGFEAAAPLGITLPEPEDRDRLQVLALAAGALDGVSGEILPDLMLPAASRLSA